MIRCLLLAFMTEYFISWEQIFCTVQLYHVCLVGLLLLLVTNVVRLEQVLCISKIINYLLSYLQSTYLLTYLLIATYSII